MQSTETPRHFTVALRQSTEAPTQSTEFPRQSTEAPWKLAKALQVHLDIMTLGHKKKQITHSLARQKKVLITQEGAHIVLKLRLSTDV